MKTPVSILLTILLALSVSDVDFHIGYPVFDEQWYFLILLTSLAIAFPTFAIPLIIIGIGMFLFYPYLSENSNSNQLILQLIGFPILGLILWGISKTNGKAFACILLGFIAFAASGAIRPIDFTKLIPFLVIDNTAMMGMSMYIMATTVFIFVAVGTFFVHLGIVDIAVNYINCRVKSPARIAILSSAVFGSVSGSAVANVMSTGQLTIPLMIKSGYSKIRAAAYEAVASTGGQLMPPVMGAGAFLMAEILMIPYWDVVTVALIPALSFYIILLVTAPNTKRAPPEHVEYKIKKIDIKELLKAISDNMYGLIILAAAVGLIIGIMDQTGLSFRLSSLMIEYAGGNRLILLCLTAATCIILGMGMPTASTYLLVAIICAPSLIEVGFTPIYAHLFVLYFGVLSMISPPVALSSFAAAKIAGTNPIATAFMSVYLALPLYIFPFIFVFF